MPEPHVERALRHGLWLVAGGLLGFYLLGAAVDGLGWDSHAYWLAWRHGLYGGRPEQDDAYLYSPAFAQVIWPLTLLAWPLFAALWMSLLAAIYAWLLWPLPSRWRAPLFLLAAYEVLFGNVWALFALTLVVGFRRPAAWAFPLLTKITPAVGIIWFAARREWRSLATVAVASMSIVIVSAAISPHLWIEWLRLLAGNSSYGATGRDGPPFVRLPIAAAMAVLAGRRGDRRLLALAMVVASPVFCLNSFAVLAALPRMSGALEEDALGQLDVAAVLE
jgi:hypothetical protein